MALRSNAFLRSTWRLLGPWITTTGYASALTAEDAVALPHRPRKLHRLAEKL